MAAATNFGKRIRRIYLACVCRDTEEGQITSGWDSHRGRAFTVADGHITDVRLETCK
jgi:hypothetical protein